MSINTNGWLALNTLIAIVAFIMLLAVFVMAVVILTRMGRMARQPGSASPALGSGQSTATTKMIQSLKAENSSLQEQLHREQVARQSVESRAETAEKAARAAASVTHEQIRQGAEKASTRELSELREKLRGAELHNLSLHQECADLRAKLAKTDRRATANNVDLNETEEFLDKASRRLGTATAERDAALREIDVLKLEIAKLKAEISVLHATPLASVAPAAPFEVTPPEPAVPVRPPKNAPVPRGRPAVESEPKTKSKPPIITRTSTARTTGTGEFDEADKQWNADEDTELLAAYLTSRNLAATAEKLRVDQKQVAVRLITLLLGPQGVIDDPSAPKHGKAYGAADSRAIIQAWRDGRKLPAIARDFQRDQLGIGWKLLDDASRPVELTADMIPDIVDEVHR